MSPTHAPARHQVWSPTLSESFHYLTHRTPGAETGAAVVYLLHGRRARAEEWVSVLPLLDDAVREGSVPPLLVVMPDAPWSDRAGFWADSAHTGRRIETALVEDLVPQVAADRDRRFVAGWSMGGAGATRLLLGHPELFAGGMVMSPATYREPPAESSTRWSGAFGDGDRPFVPEVYQAQSYPAQLATFDASHPIRLQIASGDSDGLGWAARELYEVAVDTPGVEARFLERPGEHDADTRDTLLLAGLPFVLGGAP